MAIIGLTGYARSGKDTVAGILVNEYGFTRVAFADKIKELLWHVNPLLETFYDLQSSVDEIGWEESKKDSEVRRLLQDLGVGARTIFGEDFWVNQVVDKLGCAWVGYDNNVVITDVRFVNEADALKREGGQLWRVKRPGVEAVNNHISESNMDFYKVDQILHNGGTIEELELLVQQRMDALLANKTD